MGIIQDISRILKKRELKFIESYKESEEIHSFIFEKEKDLNWKAGQHGVFSILHKKFKNQQDLLVWHLHLKRISSK